MERRALVKREIHEGSGTSGFVMLADACEGLDELLKTHKEKVKLIYLDPPFMTGERFSMRVRVGAAEWKRSQGTLVLDTFSDKQSREQYLNMMRGVLSRCRVLLRDDGMLFLHIDYRAHPYMRLLLDELFGEDNFLNEIIWAYRSGGRSLKYFSRKHDVILFYRKSKKHDFNVEEVKTVPNEPRDNHMRRHIDPDGRVYRSIRSNGRVYTYYDDEPVAPTDVWDDLSHLQQRDPERMGYDAQKPLALLERIVKCGSREGEIVLDPFMGSATTLEAAKRCGRNFIGIDNCPLTLNIARRRLNGSMYELIYPPFSGEPECEASVSAGIGFYHVTLTRYEMEDGLCERSFEELDGVDNWSVGYIREGTYYAMTEAIRSKREPVLAQTLVAPAYSGELAICVNDVLGRSFYFVLRLE